MNNGCDSGLAISSNQTEAPRFRFDSHKAALDFAKHGAENAKRWLAAHSLNFADHYDDAKLEIVLRVVSVRDGKDYHLVFRCVPPGWPNHTHDGNVTGPGHEVGKIGDGSNRDNDFVFVGISQLVQRPENIIPSFVWLARHHHVKDFFRHVFGLASYSTLYLRDIVTERELGVPTPGARSDGDGITGLVQSGAEIVGSIEGDPRQGGWQGFNQLDLMHILGGVGIWFNYESIRVASAKGGNLPFKLVDVSLGVLDAIP